MPKDFILCADDFAQSESISSAILVLARQYRINAISCLVNMPSWGDTHHELDAFKTTHFIGMHLNFTFGQPLSAAWRMRYGETFFPLPKLIQYAYTRQLDIAVVSAEIQAQLDVFMQDVQVYPDFIDGHQHIQQLPVIRDALLAIYCKQYEKMHGFAGMDTFDVHTDPDPVPCFLRNTYNGWRDWVTLQGFPKRQILACLGGKTWHHMLASVNISTNSSFGGVYRFGQAKQYRHYFKQFLSNLEDGGLIMCHPGYLTSDESDPIYLFRHHEFQYLQGDEFLQDLQDNAVQLMKKGDYV